MAATESAIDQSIIKLIKQRKGYARKTHGTPTSRGWPDIVGVYRGHPLMLEVKRPNQSYGVTPLQDRELTRWERAGAVAGVVTSKAQVVAILDGIDASVDDDPNRLDPHPTERTS